MMQQRRQVRGFTLIELMVTLGVLSIALSMAMPIYRSAIARTKEAALRQQLSTLRQLIDEYTVDKQKAPQALEDLVSGGYLKELPTDPFTGNNTSWHADTDESLQGPDQTESGIVDVHSGSGGTSLDGTPYSAW
jgi:general secretion pathway protein G